jgi:hypothetical protein
MRIATPAAIAMIAAGFFFSTTTADARSTRARVAAKPVTDSHTTTRANSNDPGGDYRGYPDWARAALGSGRGRSSR